MTAAGRRRTARRLLAASAVGAGALAWQRSADRRRAVRSVPEDIRTPLLLLPLSLTSPRVLLALRRSTRWTPVVDGVDAATRTIPGGDGQPQEVIVFEPPGRSRPTGVLLWFHGGGYVLGHPGQTAAWCSRVARDLGILVVAGSYRLAPEHPFPAGLDDAVAALRWLHAEAGALGIDPARVAVGGDSAGGGIAATLAQRARDEGGPPIALQVLVYPMLDDRTVLRTDHGGTGRFVWTPRSNRFGWTAYLGHPPEEAEARPHAVAARAEDLAGLPPAWIGVGDPDLFHAEDVAYAERLAAAGVPTTLHEAPGLYHAADGLVPGSATARRFRLAALAAIGDAIGGASSEVIGGPD
jgi:acetyl esterase/lipase